MSKKWEKHEKVDKGIELCYWKLSYRRKLIRTLWMAMYKYKKWKKEEQNMY